ncbi:MAG: beta-propeller domain-containing protein [Panacagrimonas sp.]
MDISRLPVFALAALALSACSSGGGGGSIVVSARGTPSSLLALKSFESGCEDFVDYAADGFTEEYLQQFACLGFAAYPIFLGPPVQTAGPGEGQTDSSGPGRVSGTNTQEAGVDEADIVKTDSAGRLYILSGTTLTILEAFPPEQLASRELLSLDLAESDSSFFASDLLLDEARQRVVVLGSSFDGVRNYAVSVLIDISNPAAPVETERLGVDGYALESRRIGQRVHRVSRFDVPRPEWLYGGTDAELQALRDAYFAARDRGLEADVERIKSEVRAEIGLRLEASGSAALLPRSFRQLTGQPRTETVLDCGDISHPDVTTGLGVALIDSFNVDGGARATSGIINNAWLVYASAANLYLAQPSAGWFFGPGQIEETVIYRLALSDTGPAAYRALGKVPGSVYGSYAFSEHEGFLRVASTGSVVGTVSTDTINGLSIFDAQASGEMPIVGSIEGLAAGERIQGVRLLGDRGFIVTFRQIDPLFALDLSDPRDPQVASELKIPGFSSYLAPIGEDYLLTVGRDGTDEGLSGAVAVQLFDVSDLSDVSQVAALSLPAGSDGYSYSTAEHDPHAFSYFADSETEASPGTLTLPLSAYSEDPATAFTGFLVVRVAPGTATPLSEIGRIDHEQFLADRDFCPPSPTFDLALTPIDQPPATDDFCAPAYNLAEPRRAVYMQNGEDIFLYTISAVGVLANSAQQPSLNLGSHKLPYDPPCCFLIDDGIDQGDGDPEIEPEKG